MLFLKLLFIHLLFDFLLQPYRWIISRSKKKERSIPLLLHALLHGSFTWLILWDLNLWWAGLVVFVTHWSADVWKSYQVNNLTTFLIDQGMHILILISIVLTLKVSLVSSELLTTLDQAFSSSVTFKFLAFAIAFIILLRPTSLVVKYFMQRFELEEPDTYALEHAGHWIGYFERIIILLSLLIGAYSVLGFLVASKSLLRFGDREKQSRKHTEYVLLGSLLSWGIGLLIGIAAQLLITGRIVYE